MKIVKAWMQAIWAENVKEWKIELAYPVDFVRQFIDPFIWALPYVFYGVALVGGRHSESLKKLSGSGDVVSFILLGYVLMGFLGTALWAMGMSLRREQLFGTMESVFVTPMPRWVFVFGMALHSTLHQGGIIAAQCVFFAVVFKMLFQVSGIFPSLLATGLMVFALYGIGLNVAALTLIFKEGWIVAELLYSFMNVLTPVVYPLAVLPLFMQKLSLTLPTTYGVILVRHFMTGERMPWQTWQGLFYLFLLGFLWVLFGLWVFHAVDRKIRRDGLLGEY